MPECYRDKVVGRFERCRAQFADASSLWLAAESSVQLLEHAATSRAAAAGESGIGPSVSPPSPPPTRSPRPPHPTPSAQESGIGISQTEEAASVDQTETVQVRLGRLQRLKDHLSKHIQRCKPDQLFTHRPCTCEAERW